jgi:hypothetical protein
MIGFNTLLGDEGISPLEEFAVFGTNMKQARIAAATAIEALTEDLEPHEPQGQPYGQKLT